VTSHLPDYDARARGGFGSLREDIHIHAPSPVVHRRLADPRAFADWLPPQFRDVRGDTEGCDFTLDLPLRAEPVRLRRDGSVNGTVVYLRDGAGSLDSLTWSLYVEGEREVHVTLDVAYRAPRGLPGALLEVLLHRGHRTQAFRDALWSLKHHIERDGAGARE
jgi:hypothetical protein